MLNHLTPKNVITGILVVVLLALCLWFASLFERYHDTVDLGPGPEAKQNPFLAAQKFLRVGSHQSNSYFDFSELESLDDVDTLLISGDAIYINDSQTQQVMDWLDEGGHLILGATMYASKAELFTRLGLTVEDLAEDVSEVELFLDELEASVDETEPGTKEGEAKADDTDHPSDYQHEDDVHAYLSFDGVDYEFKVHLGHDLALWLDDDLPDGVEFLYAVGDDDYDYFYQLEFGAGLVSVFNDTGLFENQSIHYDDHAFLLQTLVGGDATAFIFGQEIVSLTRLLQIYATELVFVVILALVLALWSRCSQPLMRKAERVIDRRSLSEHLRAAGILRLRHKQHEQLLLPMRNQLARHARMMISGFDRLEASEKVQVIATKTGATPEQVAAALQQEQFKNDEEFLYVVRLLCRIKDLL